MLLLLSATPCRAQSARAFTSDAGLTNSLINAICCDHNGIVWIATEDGLNRYDGAKLTVYRHRAADGKTFVGTDNDGIYVVSPDGTSHTHFSRTVDPHSAPAIILAIFEDSNGTIWLGSYADGVAQFDPATGLCRYLDGLIDASGKPIKDIYSFAEDSSKNLWIATMGGGLFRYNLLTRDMMRISDISVGCMLFSPKKNCLFLGMPNGLCSISLASDSLQLHSPMQQSMVCSPYEDARGILWAGT